MFEFNDDFEQCEPDVPFPALDLSGLVITTLEDGMGLSGKLLFIEDYNAPVMVGI